MKPSCFGEENRMAGSSHIKFDMSRREFFSRFGYGMGGMALAHLLGGPEKAMAALGESASAAGGILDAPHFAPKAKRIIYLFQSGGPSQLDLFDYKPLWNERTGEDLPASVRMGQRLTGMSANQASLPLAGSIFQFQRRGKSGAWVSDLLPYTAEIADDLCFVKSLHTEAINHDPAITFFQTGAQRPGRPSMGSTIHASRSPGCARLPDEFRSSLSPDCVRLPEELRSSLSTKGLSAGIEPSGSKRRIVPRWLPRSWATWSGPKSLNCRSPTLIWGRRSAPTTTREP
jgi:hypothetical protein